MIWITADQHFNHTNIIKYCDRPFDSVQAMNKHMFEAWNRIVRPQDIVLHLGDFALQMDEAAVTQLVSKLNGKIILIRGNHDRFGVAKYKRCGFLDVKKKMEFGNFILTHRPLPKEELNDKINFHGHTHNPVRDYSSNQINMGVEAWDYSPVNFIKICLFKSLEK